MKAYRLMGPTTTPDPLADRSAPIRLENQYHCSEARVLPSSPNRARNSRPEYHTSPDADGRTETADIFRRRPTPRVWSQQFHRLPDEAAPSESRCKNSPSPSHCAYPPGFDTESTMELNRASTRGRKRSTASPASREYGVGCIRDLEDCYGVEAVKENGSQPHDRVNTSINATRSRRTSSSKSTASQERRGRSKRAKVSRQQSSSSNKIDEASVADFLSCGPSSQSV
ncbi:unnamed protein product, partial [Amoebophrya sp. A25]|eukprot:GSA25T00003666001.1